MLNYARGIGRYFRPPTGLVFQIFVAGSFGVILGIASLGFSPVLVFGVLTVSLLVYAWLKRPEIALLGILIATSSIVFEDQLPLISVGISLHIPDILLLGSLGLIVVRWLAEPEFKIVRTPLHWPLLIFYGVTLLSTFIALLQSTLDAESARRWIRILSYYLTFFIVTNLVRERRQLNFLLNGIFFLATIVAGAMVIQFLLGDSVQLLPGRVETLNTQGNMYEDITRILPPGWSIVLISFIAIFCILVMEQRKLLRWLMFPQFCLLGIGLLVTFLRSYWAVLMMAVALLAYLFRGADRLRLIGWTLLVMSLAAIILLLVISDPSSRGARLVGASVDRLSTLGKSGTFQGEDDSLNWRMIENTYALSTIASNRWIGLGMGFTYRPWDHRLDGPHPSRSDYDFRKHIHNSHLWILLQSGLLGYLSFMGLSLVFLIRGFKYWRSVADIRFRGVVLGFAVAYLGVLIAAVVNSTFVQWRWTPVIGIIMGINEVVLIKFRQEESTV
jgi:hypothetical protein